MTRNKLTVGPVAGSNSGYVRQALYNNNNNIWTYIAHVSTN